MNESLFTFLCHQNQIHTSEGKWSQEPQFRHSDFVARKPNSKIGDISKKRVEVQSNCIGTACIPIHFQFSEFFQSQF